MPAALDTRVAVLTPQGRGAVAVIAVRGPSAEDAVDRFFHPANRRPMAEQPLARIVYGRWAHADGEEVVVCRRELGSVEVHCHGGIAASASILEGLQTTGCRVVTWIDLVADCESDEIAVAARIALADAPTQRTAAILLDQYRGALKTEFALIESLADSSDPTNHRRALGRIEVLLSRAEIGRHLTRPWRVAIGGQPNVGKSSLINALVGYERAIVFDTPGTTRDVVTALAALDGWPIEFADTAGIRESGDEVEAAGVSRAKAQLAEADLAILVFDITQPWSDGDRQLADDYPQALIVHNKLDLAHTEDERPPGIRTSAMMRQRLDVLEQAILRRLTPTPPQPGDAVPFTDKQFEHLRELRTRLER